MRNSQIEVRPIAGSIGAEIHNVDVSQDLDEATIGDIRKALLDHCVIFFRDQKLDTERHKVFTRRFGKIFIHPNYKGMQADPEIVQITREPGDKRIVGEDWHADAANSTNSTAYSAPRWWQTCHAAVAAHCCCAGREHAIAS